MKTLSLTCEKCNKIIKIIFEDDGDIYIEDCLCDILKGENRTVEDDESWYYIEDDFIYWNI